MTYNISLVTFNIGQGFCDYSGMLSASTGAHVESRLRTPEQNAEYSKWQAKMNRVRDSLAQQYPEEALRNNQALREAYDIVYRKKIVEDVEESAAERLKHADIICLQEVVTNERPFLRTLERHGFVIHTLDPNRNFSTAVAVKTEKFDNCQNISIPSESRGTGAPKIYGQEIAGVRVQLRNSNVTLAVSSLHCWGFSLANPEHRQPIHYSPAEREDIQRGVVYTREALNHLETQGADISVMGGDLNNNPQNRLEQFVEIQHRNFKMLQPQQATNLNPVDDHYRFRILDFFFVKGADNLLKRVWKMASSVLFNQVVVTTSEASVMPEFDWTIDRNCSDHKPVMTQLTIEVIPSIS